MRHSYSSQPIPIIIVQASTLVLRGRGSGRVRGVNLPSGVLCPRDLRMRDRSPARAKSLPSPRARRRLAEI
eukprot:802336-Pleurochrysis_carterae.AAC.2